MNITDQQLEFVKKNVNLISCRSIAKMFDMIYDKLRYNCLKLGIKFPKNKNNGNINLFENINKPEIVYLLGFLWADGYIKNKGSSVEISILSEDASHIKYVLKNLIKYREYKIKRKGRRPSITLTINDIPLVKLLKTQFDFHKKSNMFFNLSKIPTELHKYFLRGYLDGDGHIAPTKVSFSASYDYDWKNFITFLKEININVYKIRKYESKEHYKSSTMIINLKENSNKLLDFVYSGRSMDGIGLNRKYESFEKYYQSK